MPKFFKPTVGNRDEILPDFDGGSIYTYTWKCSCSNSSASTHRKYFVFKVDSQELIIHLQKTASNKRTKGGNASNLAENCGILLVLVSTTEFLDTVDIPSPQYVQLIFCDPVPIVLTLDQSSVSISTF